MCTQETTRGNARYARSVQHWSAGIIHGGPAGADVYSIIGDRGTIIDDWPRKFPRESQCDLVAILSSNLGRSSTVTSRDCDRSTDAYDTVHSCTGPPTSESNTSTWDTGKLCACGNYVSRTKEVGFFNVE